MVSPRPPRGGRPGILPEATPVAYDRRVPAPEHPARPRGIAALEGGALLLFAGLLAALALRLGGAVTAGGEALALAAGLVAGYAVADLFTGLAHWFGDRFFEEDSPVVGPVLIQPFREHHRDPLAMTRHGLLELTGNSALILSPLLAAAWWWLPPRVGWGGILAGAALVGFAVAALLTNLFHRWAHAAPRVPRAIARLQAWGLILPPGHHARHHQPPHLIGYCVTTGWVNRWADAIGFFRALERAGQALGLPPARQP